MRHESLFETCLDAAASVWLASCVAFALAQGAETLGISPIPVALGGGLIAALVTFRSLQKIAHAPTVLPAFELAPVEAITGSSAEQSEGELLLSYDMAAQLPELLLARAQMAHPPASGDGELLLDDVLAQLQPNSRVVQLFNPSRIATPGELKSRIDQHLEAERRGASQLQPDASQALYDALADLRRSLG